MLTFENGYLYAHLTNSICQKSARYWRNSLWNCLLRNMSTFMRIRRGQTLERTQKFARTHELRISLFNRQERAKMEVTHQTLDNITTHQSSHGWTRFLCKCICVYIHIHKYVCIYKYVYIIKHSTILHRTRAAMSSHGWARFLYICIYMYIYVYLYMYIFICMYVYMYIYTCIHHQTLDNITPHQGSHGWACFLYICIYMHIYVYIYIYV